MTKNLGWKLTIIVGILVVFVFGIFGIPKEWSGSGLLASVTDRIHLGLDLKGGTHLILQVQVNDAVNVDSDNAIARLKEDLRAKKINYAEITKPDPGPRVQRQLWCRELLDHHHEAAESCGPEESRGGASH